MEPNPGWRHLLSELRRRNVYRVAVVYAATAFVVAQVADLTFERLTLPPWTVTLVIALALLGFPIALVLAWAFEVTPEGVRRTRPAGGDAVSGDEAEGAAATVGARPAGVAVTVALALLAAGGWWWSAAREGASADRLAVLPLANLMADSGQAYFVQGMHDRLISELQQAGVPVINRTSVMQYRDGDTPAREIARELDVDVLVEGSVFRLGDSVELEARLVDPETEEYVWRGAFGGPLRDVVSLHRDLTRAIAGEIRAAVSPEGKARLSSASQVVPQAYEAYLRGVYHAQRFTPADLDRALEYFETALAADSTYAPAHVGIARVWIFSATATAVTGVSAEEARERYQPALARALRLDPDLAEAHLAAGWAKWAYEWEFEEAEEELRRAIELNPGHAETRAFYGHLLTILGRWEEAGEQSRRAVELDPLNPFIQGLHGVQRVLTRHYDEAIEIFERMFREHPSAGFGRAGLVHAYHLTGRHAEAVEVMKRMHSFAGQGLAEPLEDVYRERGYRDALRWAADTLAALARSGERSQGGIAVLHARAGDRDEAVAWLEDELESRNQNLSYIGVSPVLEPLHDHPGFRELTRRIGVPILTGPGGG